MKITFTISNAIACQARESIISFNLHNLVLPFPPFSKIRKLTLREAKQLAQVQIPLTPNPLTTVRPGPGLPWSV